jgi:hypothetical protein
MQKSVCLARGVAEQRTQTDSRGLGKTTEQCLDAYRLRSKLFAVNLPMDVGSEDNRGRGDYKRRRSRPSMERRQCFVCFAARPIFGAADYS